MQHVQEAWRRRYAAVLATGNARGTSGPAGPWPLAMGFTNSIDRIVTLDAATLQGLVESENVSAATIAAWVDSPRDLVSSLLGHLRAGCGGEIWLGAADLAPWLRRTFTGRAQVGGSGVRGANTVAGLGFGSLLHTTSLPPAQAALIDDSGLVRIPTPGGLLRPSEAARPHDPERVHYIFEYQAGLGVELGGERISAPQANRVIVSLDPANFRRPIDPDYVAAVADSRHAIRWVLVSGYSQVASPAMGAARVAETLDALARWRRRPRPPRVHLELGAMPEPAVMELVLSKLAPAVDSVGLNQDELWTIFGAPAKGGMGSPADLVAGLQSLRARLGVPRLGLHAQDFCLSLTAGDPASERNALLYGSLIAGTFARRAEFPTPADLAVTLKTANVSTPGLELGAALARELGLTDDRLALPTGTLVFAPTLAVAHPRTTIGLGDSFTAGVLALLDHEWLPVI